MIIVFDDIFPLTVKKLNQGFSSYDFFCFNKS